MAISSIISDSNEKKLHIKMPKVCNYDCSYCFQNKIKGIYSSDFFSMHKMSVINNIIDEFGITFLFLVGGEPTLFNIDSLLRDVNYSIKKIMITTNFSKSEQYFLRLNELAEQKNIELRLYCSLHDEFVDYKQFVDKINLVHDYGINHLVLEFVVGVSNKSRCLDIINYFTEKLNPSISYVVDYDFTNTDIREFYIENSLWKYSNHRNYYTITNEPSGTQKLSRQQLRLVKLPSKKYCMTDLKLLENNDLYSCYRKLLSGNDLKKGKDIFQNLDLFVCEKKACRFCHDPHIFTAPAEFRSDIVRWTNM